MKKNIILILLMILSLNLYSQVYGEKRFHKSLGVFSRITNDSNKIKIESHVTEQEIITNRQETQQKMVGDLPNRRYEIYLTNNSILNQKSVDIIINDLKIFIDDVEVTKPQFPVGFSVIIKNKPTLIYWYESNKESVDVKIKWGSINYLQ